MLSHILLLCHQDCIPARQPACKAVNSSLPASFPRKIFEQCVVSDEFFGARGEPVDAKSVF